MAVEVRPVAPDQEPTLTPPTSALLMAEQKLAQTQEALRRAEDKLAAINMVSAEALTGYYIDLAEIRTGPQQTHVANGKVVRPNIEREAIERAAAPLERIQSIISD